MNYENPDHNILVQRNSTGSITILNSIQSKAICALNKKKRNSNDCEYACFANLAAPSVSLLDRSRHPDTPTVHSCPFCSATANITKTVSRETLPSGSLLVGRYTSQNSRLLSNIIRLNVFVIVIAAIMAQLCTFVMNAVSEIYDH